LEMRDGLDAQGLAPLIIRYDDAFDTLLAPTSPSDIEFIGAEFVQRVLLTLQSMYDFVIVDSSPTFNDHLIKALESADLVLLLTTLDMPAIKNLKVAIATLDALGLPTAERRVIVNRADAKVGLTIDDVEDFVGVKVFASIPTSPEVSASTNQGMPIVLAHPKHPVSRSIAQIAEAILESEATHGVEAVA
jgi:pilus assembly protein CpaE